MNRKSWHHPTELAGTIRTVISKQNGAHLLEDQPVGFQTWQTYERTGVIQIAEIRPHFRKQGYCRMMTEALFEHLKVQNIVAVKLHCQPSEAETVWRTLGFKKYPDVTVAYIVM